MPTFTVTLDGRDYDVDAPDARTAALAASRVHKPDPRALALKDARRRTANTPALARAMASGVLGNWGDEASAGGAKIETWVNDKVSRAVGGKGVPYSPQQAYDAVMQAEGEGDAKFAREHPVAAPVAALVGALMSPGASRAGGFIGAGKTLKSRALRSMLIGGGYGMVAGAGADSQDRTGGAVKGTLMGGSIGLAVPPVLEKAFGKIAPAVEGMTDQALLALARSNPQAFDAADRVSGGALTRRIQNPAPTGPERRVASTLDSIVRDDAASGYTRGRGAPMYDRGPNIQAATEVMAQSPGPGAGAIRRHAEGVRDRVQSDLRSDLGQNLGGRGDYFETLDQMQQARRANAKGGMDLIGDHLVTLDEDSVAALRSELAQGSIRESAKLDLASADPEVRNAGADLMRLFDDLLDKPSARTVTVRQAQHISERLLKAANAAYASGNGALGGTLKGLGRAVRVNARTPERGGFAEYDDFLKQYASDMDMENAMDLGARVLRNGLDNSPEFVARELADMGPAALPAYQKAVGETLLNTVMEGGDVRVMRSLLKNDNLRQRVRMAFPDDVSFAKFLDAVEERVSQANLNNRYAGGSPTYLRQAMRQKLEGEGYDLTDLFEDIATPGQLPKKIVKRLANKKGGGLISDQKANALMGRALTDGDEMARLLNMMQTSRRIQAAPKIAGALPVTTSGSQQRR